MWHNLLFSGITERTQGTSGPPADLQAFLYISNANKIIAASFVEHITKVQIMIDLH